jgi:hypothetical protein
MNLLPLALISAVMLCSPLSARADPDPLSAYRWKHRLLVVYVPDTEASRATLLKMINRLIAPTSGCGGMLSAHRYPRRSARHRRVRRGRRGAHLVQPETAGTDLDGRGRLQET